MHITENDNVIVVTVVEDQCSSLWKSVEPYMAMNKKAIVLDFNQVVFLNSVNIAAIISARNKIVAGGGKVAVAEIKDRVKAVFRVLKLERLFNLDLDLKAASQTVRG